MSISAQLHAYVPILRPLISVSLEACPRRFNDVLAARDPPSAVLLPRSRLSREIFDARRKFCLEGSVDTNMSEPENLSTHTLAKPTSHVGSTHQSSYKSEHRKDSSFPTIDMHDRHWLTLPHVSKSVSV